MILAHNSEALCYRGLHPNLDVALAHIRPDFLDTLGEERVNLPGGAVFCTKFTYDTVPEADSFYEAHRQYLDIHLMLEGRELVDIARPDQLELFRPEPEHDFWGYHGPVGQRLLLAPGDFLVVFPHDAHRIKIQVDGPERVTKAVFKIDIGDSLP